MQKGFFAETLAKRPALWNAMLRANAGAGEDGGLAAALGGDAAPLLHWLQQSPQPRCLAPDPSRVPSGFWDFAEESRRLALLDAKDLHRLCRVTGTALHAPAIAAVLRRDEVLALRDELGPDMYRYALYRGRYELGGVRRFFAGAQEPFLGRQAAGDQPAKGRSLGRLCAWHGVLALRLVAAGWPGALAGRFAAALPVLPDLPEEAALPVLETSERDELWRAVKKLLLKEVAPSWAPCFD